MAALWALLAALLLLACAGSSDHGGRVSSGPVAEADFVDRAAGAICGNVGGCCTSSGFGFDRAGCEGYVRGIVDDAPPPNTSWDSAAAGRCLDALSTIAAACDTNAADPASCEEIRAGTLPEGALCTADEECADIRGADAWCATDGVTPDLVCAAVPTVARGASGDACDGTCTDGSCTHVAQPGTESYATCYLEDGLICDFGLGVCVPPPALDEPCPSFYCAAGAYCLLDTLVCTAKMPNGSSCVTSDECQNGLCSSGICDTRALATQAICTGQ